MFNFAYPGLLFLLLLVPAFIGLYFWSRASRMRRLRKFGRPEVLAALMPDDSRYKPGIKLAMRMLALTCLVIAAARPWGGVVSSRTDKEGCEVVLAVDASNSMLAPLSGSENGSTRMRVAKLTLEKLIGQLDNDKVGLIVYAGNAKTLIPVTSDFVSAKMFLNSIDPSLIETQGTNMAEALRSAISSFSPKKEVGKSIVLLTDAEDLESPEEVAGIARQAARSGIQVNVVGVGSSSPAMIPMPDGTFLTGPDGAPVHTALNEPLAKSIAQAGGGVYVNAADTDALSDLLKQIGKVKKTALESSVYVLHDELFPFFLWIALAAMAADLLVLSRKNTWLKKFTFFTKEAKS